MKIAIVTGASSGLGVEFCRLIPDLYKDISEIWIIARRHKRLEEIAGELDGRIKCRVFALDLTLSESIEEITNALKQQDAEIKLLINNAGFGRLGNFSDMPTASQLGMIDLNIRALTALTSVALGFIDKGGEILNVCSIASFAPNTRLTVYSSTKAYVLSFTKGLREELKPLGIKCSCVCPGPMMTEFLDVANITKGASMTFDRLPYCDVKKTAAGALKALKKGRCVYTPTAFYKLYRVIAKILPHSIVMKFSKA